MNRRWLTGHLPDPAEVRRRLGLAGGGGRGLRGWLARTLREPALWCPTRRSVAGGVATGLFVGWQPIPLQMLLAAVLASVLRVHVPVSVVMVWFTNPLTAGPLLYAAWRTGSNLVGAPVRSAPPDAGLATLLANIGDAWPAVLVGCLFWGAVSAVVGFFVTRLLWRVAAVRRWRRRRAAVAPAPRFRRRTRVATRPPTSPRP